MKKGLEKILGLKIHIVFSQIRIKHLVSKNLKFSDSYLNRQNCVYEFQCKCPLKPTYIGETSCRLINRIKTHISQGPISSIIQHTESCEDFKQNYKTYSENLNLCISSKENLSNFMSSFFKIKKLCRSNTSRKWHECLAIKRNFPILNKLSLIHI